MHRLRAATEDDYDFLKALHHAALRDVVEQTWGWDDEVQDRFFAEHWNPGSKQIIVVDGRDVGMVSLEKRPDEWFLAGIMLLPEWQNSEIGTAVIGDVLVDAARADVPVTLQVLKANRARRLYERLGFATTGETKTHILMKAEPG
jgi:ribosomal protein S18 acetylase RimI-like enzyme